MPIAAKVIPVHQIFSKILFIFLSGLFKEGLFTPVPSD